MNYRLQITNFDRYCNSNHALFHVELLNELRIKNYELRFKTLQNIVLYEKN